MVAAGWTPTVETFLGRVTKARIVEAVREGRGEQAATSIAGLRKGAMAEEAEALLAGTGWLPEPLRTPGLRERTSDRSVAPVAPSPEEGHGGRPADAPDDSDAEPEAEQVASAAYPIAAE